MLRSFFQLTAAVSLVTAVDEVGMPSGMATCTTGPGAACGTHLLQHGGGVKRMQAPSHDDDDVEAITQPSSVQVKQRIGATVAPTAATTVVSIKLPAPIVAAPESTSRTEALFSPGPSSDKLLYVGILSSPGNRHRRDVLRESWLQALKAHYPDKKVVAEFLIGRRPIQGQLAHHPQGTKATETEVQLEMNLTEESELGDIARVPMVDDYDTLSEKVLNLLSRGLERGYSFMMKIDDDQDLNISSIDDAFGSRSPADAVYAGNYLWERQGYQIQLGADGRFVKYFSGSCYVLSWELARQVAEQDMSHSVAYNMYGSKSEDVNMGRWVKWADEHRSTQGWKPVEYVSLNLSRALPNIIQHENYKQS